MHAIGNASAKELFRIPIIPSSVKVTSATFVDKGTSPEIKFAFANTLDEGSNRFVYFVADASGFPLDPFSMQRSAVLTVDNKNPVPVAYTVTNLTTQKDKLRSVIAPQEWSEDGGPAPIVISTADVPATHLKLLSAFTEKSTRSPLPGDAVALCANPKGDCDGDVQIPAYSSKALYLMYKGPVKPGVYGGNIALQAVEYASSAQSGLTIYVSSRDHVVWGVVVVLGSVLLAWWVKTWSSNRIARDQALLPVAALQSRLHSLSDTLHMATVQLNQDCPVLDGELESWRNQLEPDSLLKYGLPSGSVSPFQKAGAISADFLSFMAKADGAITLLGVFVVEGIQRVAQLLSEGRIPAPLAPKTARDVDNSYNPALNVDDARKNIADLILTAERPAIAGAELIAGAVAFAPPLLSFSKLMMEIKTLNTLAWIFLLGVSALATIITLVLKPGFGKTSDYLLCVTTAFGVPTVAGALIPAQTSTTTVTQSQPVSGSKSGATGAVVGL